MFAYAGYVPLSRLWGTFEEKYLKWCCARACEFYTAEKSDRVDIFGSPRDLCEDLFLASLSELRVTLCMAEGPVLDVDATLPGTNSKPSRRAMARLAATGSGPGSSTRTEPPPAPPGGNGGIGWGWGRTNTWASAVSAGGNKKLGNAATISG